VGVGATEGLKGSEAPAEAAEKRQCRLTKPEGEKDQPKSEERQMMAYTLGALKGQSAVRATIP
jgi:hypothetical protein